MDQLIALFDHILEKMPDAARIEIRTGDGELVVERTGACAPVQYAPPSAAPAMPAPQVPAQPAAPAANKAAGTPVKSPIVGTYYAAPSPDAPPFVAEGQSVKKGQTLCIIEAMKMMNEIESELDGVVTAVFAKNGQLIEFGQELFVIEGNGK